MADDTYFELTYQGPWKGLNFSMPENEIDKTESNFIQNMILKYGEIRTRPGPTVLVPTTIDSPIRMIAPTNVQASTSPPIICSEGFIYTLKHNWNTTPTNAFQNLAAISRGTVDISTSYPYPYIRSLGNLYFSPGFGNLVQVVNGGPVVNQRIATLAADPDLGGNPPSSMGGYYLGELGSHILMAYVTNMSTSNTSVGKSFPYRLRWSAAGLPSQWDPTVDITAGFVDLLDISDVICGLFTIGRTGYLLRLNGITEIIDIGQGGRPFDFNHLWASGLGIGNIWPFCAAQFGSLGVFVSTENVYQLTVSSFEAIGTKVIEQINQDLSNSVSSWNSNDNVPANLALGGSGLQNPPCASIVPRLNNGYIYPCYMLCIPLGNPPLGGPGTSQCIGTAVWIYDFLDKSWTRFSHNNQEFTTAPNYINTSIDGQQRALSGLQPNIAMFGALDNTLGNKIFQYDTSNFTCEDLASIAFKMEDMQDGRTYTIHKIIVLYRDIGKSQISAGVYYYNSLTGDFPVINSQPVNIGTATPDERIKKAEIPILITGERLQVQINVPAGAGPVSIIKVITCGNLGEGPHI